MKSENIEKFNDIVGTVLGHLYARFPVPTIIDAELIGINTACEVVEGPGGAGQIVERDDEDERFFLHSVSWLISAGFAQVGQRTRSAFIDVVLTSKGLEVLKAYPSSLTAGPSMGDQLLGASKNGATALLRSTVNEALSLGCKYISQSVGL